MSKSPSKLQQATELAQNAIKKTNERINVLGEFDMNMSNTLSEIQSLFDKIRNIPNDTKKLYDEVKEIHQGWLHQAKLIEEKYNDLAKNSIKNGASGAALGIGIAAFGPTAAMGIATTFGVASTGTAISALSGAAATNAALAWLGGGAIAAGGSGMAGGEALLAAAGPVGWAIGAVALLSSGIFFLIYQKEKKRLDNIFTLISERDVRSYELAITEINERIDRILPEIVSIRLAIKEIGTFGTDYNQMTEEQQFKLGSYVNLMNASTQLLTAPILGLQPKFNDADFDHYYIEFKSKYIYDEWQEEYVKSRKQLLISLANLLYKIDLDEYDRKVLAKSIKGNKDFLMTVGLRKSDVDSLCVSIAQDLLRLKYKQVK